MNIPRVAALSTGDSLFLGPASSTRSRSRRLKLKELSYLHAEATRPAR